MLIVVVVMCIVLCSWWCMGVLFVWLCMFVIIDSVDIVSGVSIV